jgi:hypothetical protein
LRMERSFGQSSLGRPAAHRSRNAWPKSGQVPQPGNTRICRCLIAKTGCRSKCPILALCPVALAAAHENNTMGKAQILHSQARQLDQSPPAAIAEPGHQAILWIHEARSERRAAPRQNRVHSRDQIPDLIDRKDNWKPAKTSASLPPPSSSTSSRPRVPEATLARPFGATKSSIFSPLMNSATFPSTSAAPSTSSRYYPADTSAPPPSSPPTVPTKTGHRPSPTTPR